MSAETQNVFEFLRSVRPDIDEVVEIPVDTQNLGLGWHSLILLKNKFCFAGGTAFDRQQARRKGLAEAIERVFVEQRLSIKDSTWLLDSHPTTKGFAAGFEEGPTKFRSICEGIEHAVRQTLNQVDWPFERSQTPPTMTALGDYLQMCYPSAGFYNMPLKDFVKANILLPPLTFALVIYETNWGTVAGYRVDSESPYIWEHALVELDRNYKNLVNIKSNKLTIKDPTIESDLTATTGFPYRQGQSCNNIKIRQLFDKGLEWAQNIWVHRSVFFTSEG